MKIPKIPLAQTIVKLCELKGIKHIVISPGSRNAPLIIGFTNQAAFKCYSIVDERCAAFFGLGMAQQLKAPVALVCTSGSALLNYYPAIAEAYYSQIPLVVISADRPKHLINVGDGQTINQKDVFANHIHYSANLKLDLKKENLTAISEELPIMKSLEDKLERFLGIQDDVQQYNEEEINLALNTALSKKGPVHINVPLSEPLYERIEHFNVEPKLIDLKKNNKPLDELTLKECQQIWAKSKKKMILVGQLFPDQLDTRWCNELAEEKSVVVLTETTSNLSHPQFFPCIDKIILPLSEAELEVLQPEVLITFGGMIVSKKVKAFLRKYQPKHHWHIDLLQANDTFFCLDKHIRSTPNTFFSELLPELTHHIKSDYKANWERIQQRRNEKHEAYLAKIPFSDLKVFDTILKSLPDKVQLQLGNSSSIRYVQLFDVKAGLKMFCNRGTSGIDGCTSTAIGAAHVNNEQTILITGDLGFFYDSNALWNDYIPKNFRIIVINNGGGGIFRILPGHKNTKNFDTFFETKHQLNCKSLCEMYNFGYASANSMDELERQLKKFYLEQDQPQLLEIMTPRTENDTILLNYFKYIK